MDNTTVLSADLHNCSAYSGFSLTYQAILAIVVLAVILNGLTIASIHYDSRKLDSHYILVVNQSAADILFALTYVPILSFDLGWCRLLGNKQPETTNCLNVLMMNLVNTACCLVLMNLLAIGLNHFVFLLKPLRYRSLVTRRRTFALVAAMYGVALLSFTVPCVHAALLHAINGGHFCWLVSGDVIVNYWQLPLLCLNILVLVPVYGYILNKSCRSRQPDGGRRNTTPAPAATCTRYRKSITSLWIILTFMGFFVVDLIFLYTDIYTNQELAFFPIARMFTMALPPANCLVDPLIYGIRLPKVRRGYRAMWERLWQLTRSRGARTTTMRGCYAVECRYQNTSSTV